jgi:hypothetical protein
VIDLIEFEVKPSRVSVKLPKRRIYFPIKRADTFGDKRKKRIRTRQAEAQKYIREMDNA